VLIVFFVGLVVMISTAVATVVTMISMVTMCFKETLGSFWSFPLVAITRNKSKEAKCEGDSIHSAVYLSF